MHYALCFVLLASCASPKPDAQTTTPAKAVDIYTAAVGASDRTPADKALDPGRKPAAFLAFMGVEPGWHVADLGAGGGYTSELLARIVGPTGKVYAQNSPAIIRRFADKAIADRVAQRADQNVVRTDRDFEDPIPPEAGPLDLVVINIFYHDTVWLGVDRDKMNKAIFNALKPGGRYVVADSSAKDGAGVSVAQELHRIDEKVVREEVLRAGFTLDATSDILRNPSDPRDWNSSPKAAGEKRGTSDRFLLRFVKP